MHPEPFLCQLNLVAIVVLVTIVCSLLFRKNNVKANVFLALLVFYVPLSIALNIVFLLFHQHRLLFLAPLNIGINLTFGPVLLCYIYLIQGKSITTVTRNVWHFVPSVIVLFSSTYYLLIPEQEQMRLLNQVIAGKEDFINGINLFLLLHIGFYLTIAWKKVAYYKHTATDLGVTETAVSVTWQRAFLSCIIVANILLLLAYVVPMLVTGEAHVYSDLIAAPVVAIGMYVFMIYKGLSYHVIYNKAEYKVFAEAVAPLNHFMEEVELLEKPQKQPKYGDDMHEKLEQLFMSQKIHTQPGLKLHDVAVLLRVSPAVLSAFINTHLKMTFFEMVNKYRVQEARRLLISPDCTSYKVEYIGELSGFNSRASFFSVFKKHVGKTPQVFKEEHAQ
ncbi:hypothetical protein GCM10011379_48900 [Filimonas zeae]|uniref:HTH araC/xylS-type domain-containing protein n=1 Tax=Filimonas zeae TaxID=1737353 RepID=A0A917J5N6_9BACT|nr:hypothetical protein GCM10011379_48900 [Filimonas zeae]